VGDEFHHACSSDGGQLADLFKDNEGNTLGAEIARRALLAPNAQHQVSRAGLDCWHAPSHPMQYRQRNDGVRAC
jgi:hypothetical protein